MKDLLDLIARIFIAFIFFYEAYDTVVHFNATKEVMTSYGIVWRQDLVLSVAIFFLVLGSLLVTMGYRTAMGAILLLFYIVPYTLVVHPWWSAMPEGKDIQFILFSENIGIIGALFLLIAHGSGKYSVRRLFATTKVRA